MGKFCRVFSFSIVLTLFNSAMSLAAIASEDPVEPFFPNDLTSVSIAAAPRVFDRLDGNQKARILNGGYLEFTKFYQGEAWPQVTVIQKVNSTPEEAMAVLTDFNNQSKFVYRVASSVAYRTNDPRTIIVDYRLDLSALVKSVFDPQYRVQNQMTKGEEGSYLMSWSLVASRDISRVEGRATVEALPNGAGTLIYYSTLMTPRLDRNFIVVRMLKSQKVVDSIVRGAAKVLGSIVTQIERLKTTRPSELEASVQRFHEILP